MSEYKVLFVLTSHSELGSSGKPTGWFLPEFAHPYSVLSPHAKISVASPAGGHAPLDPDSVEMSKDDDLSLKFLKEQESTWKNTEKLSSFVGRASEFNAIVYVGGYGPMFDLATDTTSQQIIREFYEADRIVSAVCHGPAALVDVKLSDGSYLVAGHPITGFTNAEEVQIGRTELVPFLLETALEKNGAKFEKTDPWAVKVAVGGKDGKLITGQNPSSAGPMAEAVLKALRG